MTSQLRTGLQLGGLAVVALFLLLLLDNRFRVLPNAIHPHLPAHHPGLVVIDLTVTTCSSINFFSRCKADEGQWHRIDKDLYLGRGYVSKAYVHVQRKQEEELGFDDQVVLDVKISKRDPAKTDPPLAGAIWESRPAGIWIRRASKQHRSDTARAVTGVDVLFGADAVDPRSNWKVQDLGLFLDSPADAQEARLTVRTGPARKIEKPAPRIKKDGKFKIMQVADMHLSTGFYKCRDPRPESNEPCDADHRTLSFVEKMIEEEQPDMIVMTGDQINGDTSPDAQSAIFKYSELFARHEVPYAGIFGNHDDEGDLDRAESMAIMHALPYSLSEAGPADLEGVGNYVIEILGRGSSSHSALTVYLLDTHSYSPDERNYRGYDWLKQSQIDWFRSTAQGLKRKHKEYTHIHMNLAFIHIPLPEYRNPDGHQPVGNWSEPPTAPGFNSGFKDALVEEGVVLVSCGHDHVNDYCLPANGPNGQPAIWMCYGGACGFGGYGGYYGYHRRLRFFDIDMNEARITTYKRLEWGDTDRRIDEQIVVDAGKVLVNG